jgi:CRP-like cAMP-binding protein
MASRQTFAAGAKIMAEGERTDQVVVILGGQVKVGVHENGAERVLAVRGAGQLVGGQAALQADQDAVSAVALDTVSGLVVRAKDFAAFVGAHPRVLHLAQNLLDRGDSQRQRRSPLLTGENCTVLLTDVVEFGAPSRTDSDRLLIRKKLFQMTRTALQGMPDTQSEDRGDGILTVIPPNVPTMRVVDRLLGRLSAALERHNRTRPEPVRFKLRLAINVGPVVNDMGVSGEAIIVAARLVDAPRFKEAVAESAASLGVIVSPFVYETVIRHSSDPREVTSYSQVLVEVKESTTTAWMRLVTRAWVTS